MTPTIFDVAERAGVSIGTVSRVLNNRDRVRPETRERVLAAIRDLNYQANAMARGLASQRTGLLGLVIPEINDPFFYEIVRGVEEAATAKDYNLLIATQARSAGEHRYLGLFRQGHVDAMVLGAIDARDEDVRQIMEQGVPVVLVQLDIGSGIPTFLADNYSGARALADHLVVEHGYEQVAYITGTDFTPDSRERLRALRDSLAVRALSLPDEYIVEGDYLRGSGHEAMGQLLALPNPPRAVFAANDQMAVDAMLAIREAGLRVPDDIAVVGFDDVPMASYVTPGLTTVHQPVHDLGWHAAHMALQLVAGEAPQTSVKSPHKLLLPTTLVLRHSCGC